MADTHAALVDEAREFVLFNEGPADPIRELVRRLVNALSGSAKDTERVDWFIRTTGDTEFRTNIDKAMCPETPQMASTRVCGWCGKPAPYGCIYGGRCSPKCQKEESEQTSVVHRDKAISNA